MRLNSGPQKQKLPITFEILSKLKHKLSDSYNDKLLWAAMTMAYFRLLRASEFCTDKLYINNIAIIADSHMSVLLKESKTDKSGNGVNIYIGCSKTHICPVLAMSNYMSLLKDRPQSMPLFIFSNGSFLTKTLFIKQVQLLIISCGISPNQYSGHSFRVGGATDVASSGLQDWELRLMGHWTSEAYHRYIRTL